MDIFGYLKNTHKNPKFGRVRQIPIREFPTKFPNWDLSRSHVGILEIPKNIQNWESVIFSCVFGKVCDVFGFSTLNEYQKNALRFVIEKKKDVFVNLPTGFGKSVIF